ncbi:protein FAM161B isoform X2 [Dromiciops gliroides]|uniref:protein FAM161B isoform X2 n=1 Tax=Dromiciops gliroides TaxID=33562 RepID=UPI001CC7BBFF|nr:protein FAM161B isoform X2 [Dromiciops gliroides]
MTVGRSAAARECGERGIQMFYPKASSDTETEEEPHENGIVLHRAGKLEDFLYEETETNLTTSDSDEYLYRILQAQKKKTRRCSSRQNSAYQAKPGDESSIEDKELERFFQDSNRRRPQAKFHQSFISDKPKRSSSLSDLTQESLYDQARYYSASGPCPPHRSTLAWVSSVTSPEPFQMTLREAHKKSRCLPSCASFEHRRQRAVKQDQEEAECQKKFQAQPVPAHVHLPLYQEIMERNEARRRAGIQKRKELLLSSLRPFSFLEKEEQKREATRQMGSAAVTQAKKTSKQRATKKIPKSVLEPALGDKLKEAELCRKLRIQRRAADLLQTASSPITSDRYTDPKSRISTRTRQEKLSFLQRDFDFQPRVNPSVPDFKGLYRAFQKEAAQKIETREATRNKPFQLRTANLHHRQRPSKESTEPKNAPQSPMVPLQRSRSLSGLASLSPNTLPVHITDATRKRESAIRSSLEEKKDKENESARWLEQHRKKCQAMYKSVSSRAKAMDPHKSLKETYKAKLKENWLNDQKRTKEYKRELEEMKRRVQNRPYLFEQVTQICARKEAERRYRDILRKVGLDEDFVRNKGQDALDLEWSEEDKEGSDSLRYLENGSLKEVFCVYLFGPGQLGFFSPTSF